MIARVATEVSVGQLFDYRVPDELAPRLAVGQRVRVPFGGRTLSAYVVELAAETPAAPAVPDLFNQSDLPSLPAARRLRTILAIEDETPFLSPVLLELARWMADYTCTTFELALRCMLPAAVRSRTVKPKERLYVTPCEGDFDLTPRQAELLANLRRVGGGWLYGLTREFACTAQTLKTLAEKGAAVIEACQMRRDPLANRTILPTRPLPLMPEQAAALKLIIAAVDAGARAESGARASPPAHAGASQVAGKSSGVSPAGGDARAPDLSPDPAKDGTNAMPLNFPGVIHSELGAEAYWRSRGYVPHFDYPGLVQFITFRLVDSLPSSVIDAWKGELGIVGTAPTSSSANEELIRRIARYEDAGHGACYLKQPEIAREVSEVLRHGDGTKYRLLAWSIMPNHVHALIEVEQADSVARIVHDWKSVSAHRINRCLGRKGMLWQPEYFDRYVRDLNHFHSVVAYIRANRGIQSGEQTDLCATQGEGSESGARASPPAHAGASRAAGRTSGVSPAGGDARAPDLPPKPVLLFGVTGSGKTEVYLQAIAHVLQRGLGAIVLVPEIALTPQTVQRFASRFGARIAVLHSALSDGERYDEWHRIRNGEAAVVVGPRSAVFAPVQNLGLIVVDEEHEPSYKQDEAPRYNARDVAVMRGWMERCAVVLGSATPAMESWLNVEKGKYVAAHLTQRVAGRPMPCVHIVDMRVETAKTGHVQIFSDVLLEALKLRLERGEQSILFLNRRGYATSLICPQCGAVAECPSCSVAYTYHQADTCLRCHICGGWRPPPDVCPECGDPAFKFSGFGTQRVESALKRCLPQARLLRMDADVTTRKNSHDELLAIFKSGRADILIGTQMIAKGLDFPNVTLVGVLVADTSLHMPDFRAAERTYQLLAQVSGRAGRAELPGEVYVQTFSPDHPAVQAAASDEGFAPFAAVELAERKSGGYPPYTRLVCVTFKGPDEAKVRFVAESVERELRRVLADASVKLSEACPAPLAKAKDHYRYQLLLRAPTVYAITRPLRALLANLRPTADVTLAIDVDALSLM
jgi:primosomal protein N' (replication factor Y)